MKRIEVDFNSRDASGFVPALIGDADGFPSHNELVDLFDDEGNRCFAVVAGTGDVLALTPLWQTFVEPNRSRMVIDPGFGVAEWRNALTVYLSLPMQMVQSVTLGTHRSRPVVTDGSSILAPEAVAG